MARIRIYLHKYDDGVPLCGKPGDMTHDDAAVTCAGCIMKARHPTTRDQWGGVTFGEMGKPTTMRKDIE